MTATATRRTKASTNRTALRNAVAALNEGRPEDYLALFDPEARLHGFSAGIEDVDALVRFHAATRYTWRASQGPGWNLVAQGGAIVRFDDGQIVECWNLPTEIRAVAA
jgi:hypothetical protein